MKKKLIVFVLFSYCAFVTIQAQCNENLINNAHKALAPEETVINDFKVKLNAASIDQPAPVANFSQKFEKGKKYRLHIISDKDELGGTGILRLFEGNKFLGTTYADKSNKHFPSFDFKCQKDGNYKLLVTFQEGKAGCAIVTVTRLK